VVGTYPAPGGWAEAEPSTEEVAVLRELAVTVFDTSVIVLFVSTSLVSLPTRVVVAPGTVKVANVEVGKLEAWN
jgi:hypothetical protein